MSPIAIFEEAWLRCSHLSMLHAFVENNVSRIVRADELLRAEWVARVSALDLYVHELVAQRMLDIFLRKAPSCLGYAEFRIPNETLDRIRDGAMASPASAAFDLEIRRQLAVQTFQHPEKIAGAVRLCSSIELWNAVALHQGATAKTQKSEAKEIKANLAAIVERRNKIAHEGDLMPTVPRMPWSICSDDLALVRMTIEKVVRSIECVIR